MFRAMFGFEGTIYLNDLPLMAQWLSWLERRPVTAEVVGSSPTRGVCFIYKPQERQIWLHGQAVKTSPFHGGNTGSIPVGVTLI